MRLRTSIARLVTLLMPLASVLSARADVITFNDGRTVNCVVLGEHFDRVDVALDYGTTSFDPKAIKSTLRKPVVHAANDWRIPSWSRVVSRLTIQTWAKGIQQVPSTVISVGDFRDVPYVSIQCGETRGFEINIYGDPDKPAGIEAGIYDAALADRETRYSVIRYLSSLLNNQTHKSRVRALDHDGDSIELDGLTFEITPATAPDAYGAWWVSI